MCEETGIIMFLALTTGAALLSAESLQLLTLCIKFTQQSCYQGGVCGCYVCSCAVCAARVGC